MESFDIHDLEFETIDDSDNPVQVYYLWQTEVSQIRDLILECNLSDGNDGFDIQAKLSARFVLTIFSKKDFKLQLLAEDEHGKQNWYDVIFQFSRANELIEKIPNHQDLTEL